MVGSEGSRRERKLGKTETKRVMRKSDDERQINSVGKRRRTSKRDGAWGPVRARFRGGWAAGRRSGEGQGGNIRTGTEHGQCTRSRRDARILCAFALFRGREREGGGRARDQRGTARSGLAVASRDLDGHRSTRSSSTIRVQCIHSDALRTTENRVQNSRTIHRAELKSDCALRELSCLSSFQETLVVTEHRRTVG